MAIACTVHVQPVCQDASEKNTISTTAIAYRANQGLSALQIRKMVTFAIFYGVLCSLYSSLNPDESTIVALLGKNTDWSHWSLDTVDNCKMLPTSKDKCTQLRQF